MIDSVLLPSASFWMNGRISGSPPARYFRMDDEGFSARFPEQAAALNDYVTDFPCECHGCGQDKDLLISAPDGVGKTSAAMSMVRQLSALGCMAIYIPVNEYLMAMTRDGGARGKDTIQTLCAFDLVVLDGVGDDFYGVDAEVASSLIYQLVNSRYSHCQSTCFVTSLPVSDLATAYGMNRRIVDRIRGRVIEFGWSAPK